MRVARTLMLATTASLLIAACATPSSTGPMGFFVTSTSPGNGGNLGGLAGADAHCQKLAAAVGAGNRTWRAYLSTSYIPPNASSAVHARDRIGKGPWYNAKGVLIASDVAQLHGVLEDQRGASEAGVVGGRHLRPRRAVLAVSLDPDRQDQRHPRLRTAILGHAEFRAGSVARAPGLTAGSLER